MRVSRIRRPHAIIFVAWALHIAAWLMPALNVFGFTIPGWQAFFTACSVFWPDKNASYFALIFGLSAITTLAFVVGSPLVTFRGSRSLRSTLAWIASGAFIANGWYVFGGFETSELRVGCFFWWLSFAILALGLFDLANQNDPGLVPHTDVLPERTA